MFKKTVGLLLQGEFICAQTQDKAFNFLKESLNFDDVKDYLLRLDRKLKTTRSESAFYLGYCDLDDTASRTKITEQFRVFRANLRPMVEFIQLAMNSEKTDMPLLTGDSISIARIISQVEIDELMQTSLNNIVRTSPRKLKGADTSATVNNIFDFMRDQGLIVQATKENKIFLVTGKIEYLYEVLTYIDDREEIQQKAEELDLPQGSFDYE